MVSLRFREGLSLPRSGAEPADALMDQGFRDAWSRLAAMFPGARLVPAFANVGAERLAELVDRARRLTPTYRPPRFESMFRLELPPSAEWSPDAPKGPRMASQLRQLLLDTLPVDRVTVEALLAPPPLVDTPGGVFDLKHLDPAPQGLGVAAPWLDPAGQGGNERFADVERGWLTTSTEFAGKTFTLLPGGISFADDQVHGTMVLGVVLAHQDGKGVMGVAPQAQDVVLASEVRSVDAAGQAVVVTEEAIMDALVELTKPGASPGPVLLIESQLAVKDFDPSVPAQIVGPTELKIDVFEVIQLAVANHVIVVEAAGNAGMEYAALQTGLDLDSPAIAKLLHGDSGAILVGQSKWVDGVGHELIDYSCTGKRIDCFGWGDRLITLSTSVQVPEVYFGGTSAAAAMIAGAALVLQGLWRNTSVGGTYLPPMQMRALLGDKLLNTPLADGTTDVVGVQPNLEAIGKHLGLLPNVYVRDYVGDTGAPHDELASRSPDIIVLNAAPLPSADAAFGEGSADEDSDELGDSPVAGGQAKVYVRLRNRGGKDALGVDVKVYWSAPATLVQPGAWNLIGSAKADVPKGDVTVVAGPIDWTNIPTSGHYCFVATLDHPEDRLFTPTTFSPSTGVVPADFRDLAGFARYVRVENNVAWRNFTVVDVAAGQAMAAMEAEVAGGEEEGDEEMEIAVDSQLPAAATLEIELPEELAATMSLPQGAFKKDAAAGTRRGKVSPSGTTALGRALVAKGSRHKVRLHATLPSSAPTRSELSLVQSFRGHAVGSYTWRLRRKGA